jgi:hypothetical protein
MEKIVRKCQAEEPMNKKWNVINGICKKIKDRSVELKTTNVNKNDINMNISLIRENTKVF